MAQVKVTQVKSQIDRPKDQKATLQALGLGRIGKTRTHEASKATIGMLRKVAHLVTIEEINS